MGAAAQDPGWARAFREGGSWAARLLSRGVWLIFWASLWLPDGGYLGVLGAGAEAGAGERKPREPSEVARLIWGGGGDVGLQLGPVDTRSPAQSAKGVRHEDGHPQHRYTGAKRRGAPSRARPAPISSASPHSQGVPRHLPAPQPGRRPLTVPWH